MSALLPAEPVGLSNCDQEPIHIPGRIQSHGVLLAFAADGRLHHRSRNAEALLGAAAPRLGQALADTCFATDAALHGLVQECLATEPGEAQPVAIEVALAGRRFELIGHRLGAQLLLELELLGAEAALLLADDAFKGHKALVRLKRQRTVEDLLAVAVQEVRALTGFDRVMAYRFRHDDSGDVVAEARDAALEPLAGRRYPASDIPAQARRLYLLNTLRTIVDVGSAAVPIEALQADAAPLDLSHSVLRSVSPVHIEYLSNMGVAASMSISIVVQGRLWGMLACHHMRPRHVPYRVRSACDVLAHVLAADVQTALARASSQRLAAAAGLRARAIETLLHAEDGVLALLREADGLIGMFEAQGLVLAERGRALAAVGVPAEAARELLPFLATQATDSTGILARDTQDGMPPALRDALGPWCGLLALRFSEAADGWLVLLRKEQVETIAWGGRPDKEYSHGPLGPRLTPRGSFDVWKETVRGRCVPWSETDLEIARPLLSELARASAARGADLDRARSHLLALLSAGVDGAVPEPADPQPAGGRMQRLVAQVLDAARVRGGTGLDLQRAPVDLAQLVHAVVDEVEAAQPALRCVREVPRSLVVQGHAARLRQLLVCLVGNAARHGAVDEAVVVQLRVEGEAVVLDVSNVAPEIAAPLLSALFDPFQPGAAGLGSSADGLRLGLYIARQIARAHGGELEYAYAEPYVVFTFRLPA
ncbi:GAF domain-containing protein [Pseudorhodoferax sp.]|uniref:GAF domain-containing protein n=1 Tax=Pseudorhodoferax sp. TaxID=1993553 RepID=UPI002DD6B7E6|nr:GAF domain-containing protein [Pseudorhodoferax sp.]